MNCAALAEAKMGSAKESRITLCLTVGTGIGASLLLDKKVYHGAGFCAMEAGYMYMDGSDFQSLASGGALCERVAKRKGGEKKEWNGRRIFSLAKAGDAVCTEEIRYTVDCLAKGIANLCYAVNPDCVVLGGGIMEQEAYLRPLLESSLKARLRPVLFSSLCLFFASFGNDAGMYGAYLHFLSRRERN